MNTLLIVLGTFIGGAAAAVSAIFGWLHHQQTKRAQVSDMAKELQVLRTDDQIDISIKRALQPVYRLLSENTEVTQSTNTRLTKLETSQFGSNGGGIREAVNAISAEQSAQGQRIARIEGILKVAS